MAALDTNVLVRFIVEDDAAQCAAARALVGHCVAQGESLFVPVTVVLELEWVLRSRYGFAKADVLQALAALCSARELHFESERAMEVALQLYRESAADFADALHVALTAQELAQPLWTFDKGAARLGGAQLLSGA